MFAEHGGFSEYDSEIGQRLGQLHWILDQTTKLHKKVLDSCEDRLENLDNWAMDGLEIMTESFYFYTGRLAEIFKMNPNFSTLPKTCAELVRHRLLQHPEKEKSKAKPLPSFYAGSLENGPEIKSYIGPDGSQNDGGLFINAKELDNVVANVINRATENIPNKSSNLTGAQNAPSS